jgi:hypothetical protein
VRIGELVVRLSRSTARHSIEVVHSDLFLLRPPAEHPSDVIAALEHESALRNPAHTLCTLLATLTTTVPMFAKVAADAAVGPPPSASPMPALLSDKNDE